MCGIAGFIAKEGNSRASCAPAVLDCIQHRGPDDYGWLRMSRGKVETGRDWILPSPEPEVLLLHRRLSILDTTEAGRQPMKTPDDRYHLVYNGEIYNYQEIREELEVLGHRFTSLSDTEVMLAAYAEWGIHALRRFVGMFAFALLDTHRRVLVLGRDFFGIKPLYYAMRDGFLCFGSEIKVLLTFGLSRRQADIGRLLLYLRYGITDAGAGTLLSNVYQVPAGHYLELSLDGDYSEKPQAYWRLESIKESDLSFDEAAQCVRELFLRNIELHLRSDVPLGAALSGGIDSSSIVMAIRHLRSDAEIHAFSFIPEDSTISEEVWVDIVGRAAGAHVHKVRATEGELEGDLVKMMGFHDEPFGSTSAYAQYRVFRAAAAAGVKVMLDGQGADEILGGYRFYLGARLASLLRQRRWLEAVKFTQSFSRVEGFGKYNGLAFCADCLLPPSLQSAARKLAGKDALPEWLDREWFAARGVGAQYVNYTTGSDVLKNVLARSISETLPGLLRYEDRNSMAFSVESRVPFLTPDLVSFLGQLPENFIISADGTSKAVFRQAMRGIVPDVVLNRRDKLGFVTPERRWLSKLDGLVQSMLSGDIAQQVPFLNLGVARKEWDLIREGRRSFDFRVWRWINLIRWTQEMGVSYS